MEETKKKQQELTELLKKASYEYYNTGQPIMEDSEFDVLLDELQRYEAKTGIVLAESPTQNAGSKVAKEQTKITHEHLMLSLDKIHTVEEIEKFIDGREVLVSLKLDGLSLSATYINGELARLETRGNGEEGTNVLIHKNSINGLPLHINHNGKYVVDGECIVKLDDFNRINEKLSDEDKFSNPRNMASGSLNLLDSNISATRGLSFVVWNVIEDSEDFAGTMSGNFLTAQKFGFTVVPYTVLSPDIEYSLDVTLTGMKHIASEENLPIDGCVFSQNNIEYGRSLGRTSHHFNHSIAYKYADDDYETPIISIDWTMGKTGVLTPTAVFETVHMEDSDVNRASLHNVSIFKSLELGEGDIVKVYKANQVIPQLRDNITRSNTFEIPTICPICNGKTEIAKDNDTEVLICTNPNCKGKLLGKLTHFVSKNAINIDGLSEQTLQKFIDLGWLTDFKSIYHLSSFKGKMYNLDGFGKKSVDKLLENIEKSRNTTLSRFIYSLSIPLIGKSASKIIAKHFGESNIEGFVSAWESGYNFTQLDDFGATMNTSMREYIKGNAEMLSLLIEEFNFEDSNKEITDKPKSNADLSSLTFVITGSLEHYKNRDELVEVITSLGGKVSGSITTKSSYLINNNVESTSGKNKKAKELNIPIISEQDFINMIS